VQEATVFVRSQTPQGYYESSASDLVEDGHEPSDVVEDAVEDGHCVGRLGDVDTVVFAWAGGREPSDVVDDGHCIGDAWAGCRTVAEMDGTDQVHVDHKLAGYPEIFHYLSAGPPLLLFVLYRPGHVVLYSELDSRSPQNGIVFLSSHYHETPMLFCFDR